MHGGIKMSSFRLILSLVFTMFFIIPASADDNLTYVAPETARAAIEKHFGAEDAAVLSDVMDAYNEMLSQNDGFVSIDGVMHVCDVAFDNSSTTTSQGEFAEKCVNFATDLVSEQTSTTNNCPYTVSKVNGSQMHIKYSATNGGGFIRNGGTIPWRFLNPGALRGSPLTCAYISTKPNGTFAVFESEEIGKKALHLLLSTGEKYKGKTIAQAIRIYAPAHENDTTKYINDLKSKGINVNKVLPNLTASEWSQLENAIMTLEGWRGQGTIEHF